jgi:uncharacterized protein (TIGR02646 family)
MLPYNRPAPMTAFTEKWKEWTAKWIKRREKNVGAKFYWPKYPNAKGTPINQQMVPILFGVTEWHCAYCDQFPLHKNDETIDHFKPKSQYPELAYIWDNLFPACSACQSAKMEQFDELLIKPDELGYDFHDYFIVDYITFELLPSPKATEHNKRRAEKTIELLDLRHKAHCIIRGQHYERFRYSPNPSIDDYPYRYLF